MKRNSLLKRARHLSMLGRLILFGLASAEAAQGAERMTRFAAEPGGKVSIKGSCDVHDFEIQGKELSGEAEFGAGFLAANSKTVTPGQIPVRIVGFIPVRSLHYGASVMDKSLYYHLKEETNFRICFRFRELNLKAMPNANDAPYEFDAQGELVVAGVTNQISMPMQILVIDGNKLKLSGTTSARMTDFGISPPVFRGNHTIKYRDEVRLSVEWLVGREPVAAGKDKP